jgi:hypothetical protein
MKYAENIFMKTKFWFNMENARIAVKKERKEIIAKCGLTANAFTRGLERESDPGVSTAYKCARAVTKTVEELVDGEAGAEYVRDWARRDGKVWQPPPAIADIVDGLMLLDDGELYIIRGVVKAAIAGKKERENDR